MSRDIRISMTESGDPLENAVAERINGILKTEWLDVYKPFSLKEMVACVGKAIDLYNNQRPHQSIDYLGPEMLHQTGQKTERRRKTYYRKGTQWGSAAAGELRFGYAFAPFPCCNENNITGKVI